MTIDLNELFTRGSRPLLDLLEYCVISVQLDPLFIYLASEFRYRPTSRGAVALYDIFCSDSALGRDPIASAIPHRDPRMRAAIVPLRQSLLDHETMLQIDPAQATAPLIPPQYLFDSVVAEIQTSPIGSLAKVARRFDPSRTPLENLPGESMTISQRTFVDTVWRPTIRVRLVEAGFWRVQSIG